MELYMLREPDQEPAPLEDPTAKRIKCSSTGLLTGTRKELRGSFRSFRKGSSFSYVCSPGLHRAFAVTALPASAIAAR